MELKTANFNITGCKLLLYTKNMLYKFDEIIELNSDMTEKILFIVVGNSKEKISSSDYKSDISLDISEHYSMQIFRKTVNLLREKGFEVLPYYNNMDYIFDYASKIRKDYYKKMFVLELSQLESNNNQSLILQFCEINNIPYYKCMVLHTSETELLEE